MSFFSGAASSGLSNWRVKFSGHQPDKKIIGPRPLETSHSNYLLRRCYPVDVALMLLSKCLLLAALGWLGADGATDVLALPAHAAKKISDVLKVSS